MLISCSGGSSSPTTAAASAAASAAVIASGGVTLVGVVAIGSAVANAAVSAIFSSGSGTATSSGSGTYLLTISGGALPCVLQAGSSDGRTVLHAVAIGSAGAAAGSATANITPLTELLVADLTGQLPASYYAGVGAGSAGVTAVTASAVANAQSVVAGVLTSAGVNTAAAGDFVSGTLVAGSGGSAGNACDTVLAKLSSALGAAGTTLATLTGSVAATAAASSGGSASSGGTEAIALPPAALLQPAASSCSAPRGGSYRVVEIRAAGPHIGTATLDATQLTLASNDGGGDTFVATANCHYTSASDSTSDVVVSQAGILVPRTKDNGAGYQIGIAFAEQPHPLADLAGTWNLLGLDVTASGAGYSPTASTFTFDTSGVFGNVLTCQNDSTCRVAGADCLTKASLQRHFVLDSGGGFDDVDSTGATVGRNLLYQSGSGDLMMIHVPMTAASTCSRTSGP